MIFVRRGACLSKIESKTESYWSQSSVISWDGELYKDEERISRRSGSMVRSLRDEMVSFQCSFRWSLDSQGAMNSEVIRDNRVVHR